MELLSQHPVPSRRLYVLKEKILEFWPFRIPETGNENLVAKIPKPRPASSSEIRDVLRRINAEAADHPPNHNIAEQRIRKLLPTARRILIRQILKEPEFANVRWRPGQRK